MKVEIFCESCGECLIDGDESLNIAVAFCLDCDEILHRMPTFEKLVDRLNRKLRTGSFLSDATKGGVNG